MKIIHIKDKLEEIGFQLENLSLGDIDVIGEVCAKKCRNPSEPLYRQVGAFYRPNYERGILVYALIRTFKLNSVLEIGTGRGMVTFCAAKAFSDMGIKGRIMTIDAKPDEQFFENVKRVFPSEWFDMIEFIKGDSTSVLNELNRRGTQPFDLVYVDGDHSYEGTKSDLTLTQPLCSAVMLCDDYHLPSKNDPGIKCAKAIDEFDHASLGFRDPELIRMDRRIFFDDRRLNDDSIDYGQVLLLKNSLIDGAW